jgi:deoxyribodipyrimidine photo-lyase
VCLFIFDTYILEKLQNRRDERVTFIHNTVTDLHEKLKKLGSGLIIRHGEPAQVWRELIQEFDISAVYTNHDYEPYAVIRDQHVSLLLKSHNIDWKTFKDHVIFEKTEVKTGQGGIYTVFTPYSRAWKTLCNPFYLSSYPTEKYFPNLHKIDFNSGPHLNDLGFVHSEGFFPTKEIETSVLENYHDERNFPAKKGTTHIGIHLRFGTVSIRELARLAQGTSEPWLNELIWRDFYQQILWNFPHVGQGKAFRPAYDQIKWRNNEAEFLLWTEGRTGYPLVDAGMRELNATGFMHNRVRMVTASFLTKHLLIDWRWGEAFFAEKLLDFDFASNNGGWQWAAGSGTDAAPYFRIFNPVAQAQKFDPKGEYIRKWVPEFNGINYPSPIVDHSFARERCLRVYKEALNP